MSFAKFSRTIKKGDTVMLYIGISQIYAIEVKPTIVNKHGVDVEYTFQSKYGALRVMDLVGKPFGSKINLTKGYGYALYPTPELWTQTLPHRTQILYTPDISLIITELEIKEGSIVCEAGTGSGSLSHSILRAVGSRGHLYTCDFHQERVEVARREFSNHGHGQNVTAERRDVCESGWGVRDAADAVFLDLPKPWEALGHALESVRPEGGRICSFSPCIEQVCKTVSCMRDMGLTEINSMECLQREFQFRSIVLPPVEFNKVKLDDAFLASSEPSTKKKKVSSLDDSSENLLEDENESSPESDLKERKSNSNKDHKIKTAIPLLKMPGHTGFLTFASVPPKLKKFNSKVEEENDLS